jgi:hypothetical protein
VDTEGDFRQRLLVSALAHEASAMIGICQNSELKRTITLPSKLHKILFPSHPVDRLDQNSLLFELVFTA